MENRFVFKDEVYKKLFKLGLSLLLVIFVFILRDKIREFVGVILGILYPFILGAALAFVIKMPMNFIEEKFLERVLPNRFKKFKRPLALIISLILILLIISFILLLILPQLFDSAHQLQQKLPNFISNALQMLRENKYTHDWGVKLTEKYNSLSWKEIFQQLEKFVGPDKAKSSSKILSTAVNTATSILGKIFTVFLALVTAIYILISKERLGYQAKRLIYAYSEKHKADSAVSIAKLLHDNFHGFIKGQLIDSFILGVIIFAGTFAMRIPNSAMLAVLVGVTNIVPIVGPFLGAILGFILIVIEDTTKAVIFVIFVIIMQQFESNIIYPRVVGGQLGLPALWTLIAIALGGSLFGVVGMWVFIPVASTIFTILKLDSKRRIDEKELDMRKV